MLERGDFVFVPIGRLGFCFKIENPCGFECGDGKMVVIVGEGDEFGQIVIHLAAC